jgi:hypothetical protein
LVTPGLRVHDLRREATSPFFELGLNVMEVASVTGHKTVQMLAAVADHLSYISDDGELELETDDGHEFNVQHAIGNPSLFSEFARDRVRRYASLQP